MTVNRYNDKVMMVNKLVIYSKYSNIKQKPHQIINFGKLYLISRYLVREFPSWIQRAEGGKEKRTGDCWAWRASNYLPSNAVWR